MNDPLKPTGSNAEAQFAQKSHGAHWGVEAQLRNSRDVKIQRTADGVFFKVRKQRGGNSVVHRAFFFQAMFMDYIIGADVVTGQLVQIAKPEHLFGSYAAETISGVSYTMTYVNDGSEIAWQSRNKVGSDGSNENQRITPAYLAAPNANGFASIIWAISSTAAYIDVASDPLDILTPAGTPLVWKDMNEGGRAWGATSDGNP